MQTHALRTPVASVLGLVFGTLVALSLIIGVARAEEATTTPAADEVATTTEEAAPTDTASSTPVEPAAPAEPAAPGDTAASSPAETPDEPSLTPVLTTGKEDYHPGEVADIFGSLFGPLQSVVLKIFGSDDNNQNYTEEIQNLTTGEDGSFEAAYTLDDLYRPFYEVYAYDTEGKELASTWFRDSSVGTYDQCSNDDGDGFATGNTGCRWITGAIGQSNSTYFEGDSTPQRVWLEGFVPGSSHTVTFKYGTTKAGKHAYDYLTTYNKSENWIQAGDQCEDITGCTIAAETTAAMKNDPNAPDTIEPDPVTRLFTIRGGTITAVSVPSIVSGTYGGDSETVVTVTFSVGPNTGSMCSTKKVQGQDVTSCGIAIWFGAHISESAAWTTFNNTTGAGSISGNPYHVALDSLDGASIGQRDNQMSAAAIVVPTTATLTLLKTVVNDNGGTAQDTNWTLSASGPTPISGTEGAAAITNAEVDAGAYTLSESGGPSGYTASQYSCVKNGGNPVVSNSITLAANDVATCTITNNDNAPSLTLVKQVVNDNGGTAVAGDWTLTAQGYDAQSPDAGTYNLSESGPSGYTQTSLTCTDTQGQVTSVTLSLGENVTCTFVNDDNAPQLHLRKTVTNDNGGTAPITAWTLTATGAAQSPTNLSGTSPVDSGAGFKADTYALAETGGPSGYTAGAWDCGGATMPDATHVTVPLGGNVTCTINNDDIAPVLHLRKVVVNDNGGTALNTAWTLSASGAGLNNFAGVTPVDSAPNLKADTFALMETGGPGGYASSSWVCVGGTQNGDNITLGLGQEATCTITNDDIAPKLTLTKVVTNDDGGNAVVADFPLFVDGNPVVSGAQNTFNAGAHTASETNLAGYTAGSWGGDCAANGSITLGVGDIKACTITNDDQPARVVLIKNVINDNGGTAGANSFGLTVGGSPVTSGATTTVNSNTPVALNEAGLAGYNFVSITGAGCPATLGGTVTLNEGQTITCTITNDDDAPSLVLVKQVVNDNGGTAQAGDWTLTAAGYDPASPDAGTYNLSETGGPAGYTQTSLTCSNAQGQVTSVTLSLGEDVTCTFVNDDKAPMLVLNKVVVNDNGGTAAAGDFTLTADGTGSNDISGAGTASSSATLQAGTFALSETSPTGYSASAWECAGGTQNGATIAVALGESAVCTITNNDIAPTLTVIKHVINDNGGTATAANFTLDAGGTNDSPDDFAGTESPGTVVTLDAGAYNVTESGPSGYAASFSADCTGSLAVGQNKTCTVTNDDIQPKLTLTKTVTNDNGGNAVVADFPLFVNATGVVSGVQNGFNAGSYTASETSVAGYTPSSWGGDCAADGSITLGVGDIKACTITNDDQAAHIILNKVVTNDNGGTAGVNDFGLTVGGSAVNSGDNTAVNSNTPIALNEAGLAGYSFVSITEDAKCPALLGGTVTLNEGETVTCTITNDDDAPSLTLVKNLTNDNGGTAVATDWTLTAAGYDSASPDVGTYNLSETGPSGYAQTSLTCSDTGSTQVTSVTLGLGEDVTCTFVNDDIAPQLTVIKHVINDNGGTTQAGSFTMNVTGTNVSDASFPGAESPGTTVTLNAGTYSVDESLAPGYIKTLSADCSGTIAIGQTKTCTITNNDTPGHFTGGGSIFPLPGGILAGAGKNPKDNRVTHGFTLHCDASMLPNRLEINWGPAKTAQKFHLITLDTAACTDTPGIDPQQPNADFDTITGTGTGRFNNVDGAKIEFVFTDAGEPGKNDTAKIKITNAQNVVVLDTATALNIDMGNQQAHQDN